MQLYQSEHLLISFQVQAKLTISSVLPSMQYPSDSIEKEAMEYTAATHLKQPLLLYGK